ncbi:arylsulfatase I-like [Haemaphysalis longicornis]
MFRTAWYLLALQITLAKHNTKPHIVFMIIDDLGWSDVSFHGSAQIPTSNIDTLAADGIILRDYYVQPHCTPSRSALFTGRYPIHTGMQHYPIEAPEPWGLSLNQTVMPQYFKGLGYEAHIVGKWHLGFFKETYTPTFRGFDSFLGHYTEGIDYYNHSAYYDGGHVGLDFWLNRNPLRSADGQYSTNLYGQRAKYIVENRNKSKPLFLYFAHQATQQGSIPGRELQAPQENIQKFPYIGERNRTIYAGMVDAVDQTVGELVEALYKEGMLNNTIFVFSADNGGRPWGENAARSFNWPLRGAKGTLFEGGIRAAGFVWSPLLKQKRRVSRNLMHIVDWLPTLYAAAGGDVKDLGPLDGFDMWRRLSMDQETPRKEVLCNIDSIEGTSGIILDGYKLVLGTAIGGIYNLRFPTTGGTQPTANLDALMNQCKTARVLRELYGTSSLRFPSNWREKAAIKCPDGAINITNPEATYLFHLEEDPCELVNLAPSKPEVVSLLKRRLAAYNATAIPPRNKPADPRAFPENHNGTWVPWLD